MAADGSSEQPDSGDDEKPPDLATVLASMQMQLELLTGAVKKIQANSARTDEQLSRLVGKGGSAPGKASAGRSIMMLQDPSSVSYAPGQGRRGWNCGTVALNRATAAARSGPQSIRKCSSLRGVA